MSKLQHPDGSAEHEGGHGGAHESGDRTGRADHVHGRWASLTRWKVAGETAAIVVGLVLGKMAIHALGLEFISLSPLYTSVVAGGIFVIGLLVAGTLADYKEAERMPAEIRAALENIHQDGVAIQEWRGGLDLGRLRRSLADVVSAFMHDVSDARSRSCLSAIDALSTSFLEMERMDVPPNYIVRLRTEQGLLRRSVLRIYHIQRVAFLPSAYVLIQTIVGLIILALLLTKIDPVYESIVVLAFISYFFIYLVRLLGIIDRPFRHGERTMDDVSLFLLHEFEDEMRARLPDRAAGPREEASRPARE